MPFEGRGSALLRAGGRVNEPLCLARDGGAVFRLEKTGHYSKIVGFEKKVLTSLDVSIH
jgi:hypothetical protein